MTPLFIFSLPRSGSTLLQRILASHSDIATVAEPWILLPQLYALKGQGILAEYNHQEALLAIEDFCSELPNGKEGYFKEMGAFISRLYAMASPEESVYFLDKTPRYHLIVDEIIKVFPEAKFIFLWRNPLAVCASIQETWARGKWNLHLYKIDLYAGVENLVSAYERYGDRSCGIRFEDLLVNPEEQIVKILDYLGLRYQSEMMTRFKDVKFLGRMGDPTGVRQYSSVNVASLSKWKRTLRNPVRKMWGRRYLKWIGRHRLAVMGYDLDSLLSELGQTSISLKFIGSDLFRIGSGALFSALAYRIVKMKLRLLLRGKRIYDHS